MEFKITRRLSIDVGVGGVDFRATYGTNSVSYERIININLWFVYMTIYIYPAHKPCEIGVADRRIGIYVIDGQLCIDSMSGRRRRFNIPFVTKLHDDKYYAVQDPKTGEWISVDPPNTRAGQSLNKHEEHTSDPSLNEVYPFTYVLPSNEEQRRFVTCYKFRQRYYTKCLWFFHKTQPKYYVIVRFNEDIGIGYIRGNGTRYTRIECSKYESIRSVVTRIQTGIYRGYYFTP